MYPRIFQCSARRFGVGFWYFFDTALNGNVSKSDGCVLDSGRGLFGRGTPQHERRPQPVRMCIPNLAISFVRT